MPPRPLLALALLIASQWIATDAQARIYVQQGNKLVGAGAVGAAFQGRRVAISADGNTVILGGYADNTNQGAAWVFTRSGGTWTQQGLKLVGTGAAGAAQQGFSVALSADGNTALLGGFADNSIQGAAWVFVRSGGVWSQQGAKLVGTGATGAAAQGRAVALSADGNTAIVGGSADNSNVGAAWVFVRNGGVWSQQGVKLVGTGAVGGSQQGYAVTLSADGNTALVAGFTDNSNAGATWVYVRNGGVWSQQGVKLVGSGAVGSAQQGLALSLSGDGNTALVGGYADNSITGAVWTFTRSGSVWSQQGAKLVGTDAVGAAGQGTAVALSADGTTALVGAYADNGGSGASWFYLRNGSGWTQVGKLIGTGATGVASQGYSAALSADGSTAVVGGYIDNANLGAAWVFVRASPLIASVRDVPNDQGGRVSIRWAASLLDYTPNNSIDQYWIWRQVPARAAVRSPLNGARAARAPLRTTIEAGQTYYWEYVGSQIAHGFSGYSYTAPTLFDSIPGSNPLTLFMVEAERTTTGEYWSSDPDSGYSVDNVAPAPPAPFTAAYAAGATHLHWGVSLEPDFSVYRLYRGGAANFVPGSGNLVASQPDTGYADVAAPGGYYKLSAVDTHGNESGFALITPGATSDVPRAGPTRELSLAPVVPDPLREGGTFRYALPGPAMASLAIYDASGRRVRRLASGPRSAGEHVVQWDGRDDAGRSPASGVYFVRLVVAGRSLTARFARVR